jgi:hypothetical protein
MAFCLALLPFADVAGSNRNYWQSAAESPLFWSLAGIVVLGLVDGGVSWRKLLPAAAAIQLGTILVVSVSTENPYRQTHPLRDASTVVRIGEGNSTLRVTDDFAGYVAGIQRAAFEAGFKKGGAVIDLTGHYPGSLYALGAVSVGRPWLIGSYPGSDAIAVACLDLVPCSELTGAWVLTEPTGPCRFDSKLLSRYGIDLERDYAEVVRIPSPAGDYPKSYEQRLLRPIRDPEAARAAYENLRVMRSKTSQ